MCRKLLGTRKSSEMQSAFESRVVSFHEIDVFSPSAMTDAREANVGQRQQATGKDHEEVMRLEKTEKVNYGCCRKRHPKTRLNSFV